MAQKNNLTLTLGNPTSLHKGSYKMAALARNKNQPLMPTVRYWAATVITFLSQCMKMSKQYMVESRDAITPLLGKEKNNLALPLSMVISELMR